MRSLAKYLPALFLVGTVSILRADTPPAPAPAPAPAETKPADPTSIEARQKAAAAMSAADMQTKAAAMMAQLPEDYRHVTHLKETAKNSKDVLKLTCVNDKLVQIKAQMDLADTANADLQGAISNNAAPEGRASFYVNLSSTTEAVAQLRRDADVCAGTPELYKQEAGATVEAPDLPDPGAHDPFGLENPTEIEPPGYASPFN